MSHSVMLLVMPIDNKWVLMQRGKADYGYKVLLMHKPLLLSDFHLGFVLYFCNLTFNDSNTETFPDFLSTDFKN